MDTAPAAPPRRSADAPAIVFIIVLAAGLRLWLLHSIHATEEDFFITLRFAENLAHGHGFSFNPGVQVYGSTTPLYTLLLALFVKLHLDPILWGKLSGIAADCLTCFLTYRLGNSIGRPVAGLFAAACVAAAPVNLIWATKGMEVGIVAAAAVGAWAAWAEGRELLAWTAAAILVLLRIDGAILAIVLFIAWPVLHRRLPWRGLALFALLILPWMLYAALTFRSIVPLSLHAKLIVYGRLSHGMLPNLRPFVEIMTHNPFGAMMAIGSLLYIAGIARSASPRDRLLLAPAAWALVYYAGMALSRVFLFGWYFVPPTPLYYLVALVGWAMTVNRIRAHISFQRLVYLFAVLLTAAILPRTAATLRQSQQEEETLRIPIGQWLRSHSDSRATVMLEPIGYIGYYSRLPVLDTVGLVSPEVLPYYSAQYASPYHEMWTRFHPFWILLRAGEVRDLTAIESRLPREDRLEFNYQLANSWPKNRPQFLLYINK